MKEEGLDGAVVGGFKAAEDGWHIGEFQEGIEPMKTDKKKGEEKVWQDEKGNFAYRFSLKVVDPEDDSDGAIIGFTAFPTAGEAVATMLAAVGLWEAVCKKFPGKDVSVFDKPVMDGIKAKVPGRQCMVRSEIDKGGFAKAVQFASFVRYKEILAEEKKAGKSKKTAAKDESTEKAPESPTPDDWG